jgi:hypothetical protein
MLLLDQITDNVRDRNVKKVGCMPQEIMSASG